MKPFAIARLKKRSLIAVPETFYDLVMAQAPVNYWRNGETSGSVMVDEVAADGVYTGGLVSQAPLYPGAGALNSVNLELATIIGTSNVFPASLAAMTLMTIVKTTDLGGYKLIGPQRDQGTGGRKYQWRSNGADLEFVKIVGGVTTVALPNALAANATYLLSFDVDATGNYKMRINGAVVKTGSIPAADYGGGGDEWKIGYASGPATYTVGPTCENVVFDKILDQSVHEALFAATGL